MTKPRPYIQMSNDELAALANRFVAERDVLGVTRVLDELDHRTTPSARRLKAKLEMDQAKLARTPPMTDVEPRVASTSGPTQPAPQDSEPPTILTSAAASMPQPSLFDLPLTRSVAVAPPGGGADAPEPLRVTTLQQGNESPGKTVSSQPPNLVVPPSAMPATGIPDPTSVVSTRDGVAWVAAIPPSSNPPVEQSVLNEILGARTDIGDPGVSVNEPAEILTGHPSKILKLFEFIQAWRDLNDPPIRRLENYEWNLRLSGLPAGLEGEVRTGIDPANRADGIVLTVRRPRAVRAPPTPAVLVGWVVGDSSDWRSSLGFRLQRLTETRDGGQVEEFAADSRRPSDWKAWMTTWYAWAIEERERHNVTALYAKLFELRGRMEGRSHEIELAVGAAVLDWPLPGGGDIQHPLLLKRVTLEFDNQRAEITLREGDGRVEFASRVLAQAPIAGRGLALARQLNDELQPHPLDREGVLLFLRGVMNSWFGDVSFRQSGTPRPDLRLEPVIVLRHAGSQVGSFVERILAELKKGAASPDFLDWLTGDGQPPAIVDDGDEPSENNVHRADDDEDELFFTKPANQEQRRILRLLNHQSAIVVQGPPGTGKTHTIGNLIGHFLSQGWRVLVTSETTKALGEVRNQVVPGLSSLCIPLLDSDRDGRELLRACLQDINNQAAQRTTTQLNRDVDQLQAERDSLLASRRDLRRRLLDARGGEVAPIVIGGIEYRPIDAAKRVVEVGDSAQWLPGPLLGAGTLPLEPAELVELYASNRQLTAADDRALALPLPDPDSLPPASTLAQHLERLAALNREIALDQPRRWKASTLDVATLDAAAEAVDMALRDLNDAELWRLAAVEAGIRGQAASLPWKRMIDAATEADRLHGEAQELRFQSRPEFSGADDAQALEVAKTIWAHLSSGRPLRRWWSGIADASWKPYLERWRLGGHPPRKVSDFAAIATILQQLNANRDFVERLAALVTEAGGPDARDLGEQAAVSLRQHVAVISRLIGWHTDVWTPLRQTLMRLGLDVDGLLASQQPLAGSVAEAERIVSVLRGHVVPLVRGRRAAVTSADIAKQLTDQREVLSRFRSDNPESEPLADILRSWELEDPDSYRDAVDRLAVQRAKREPWRRRHEMLARVHSVAPAWAEAIRSRRDAHGSSDLPGDPQEAWLIRQLDQALADRHRVSIARLSQDLAEIERKLPKVTAALVAAQAWRYQIDRLASEAGLALRQWAHLMNQVGAGTGSRAQDLLRAVQRLTASAMTAVPVWIMPIWRVFQTVVPSAKTRFDVLIIDEASQANLKALPLLYLAKRVIVVGDEEQVTPSAVGERLDDLRRLQAEYLTGFRVPEIFAGKESLYTIAQTHFGVGTTALREHFRCVPDIIAFSNQIAYQRNGRPLLPLRDAQSATVTPAVLTYRVKIADSQDGENLAEARVVTALLGAMIEHPAYQSATFGVIHLVGDQQDRVIEGLIREQLQLDDERIERLKGGGRSTRRLCGKPPDFQGDERTVILLSMVDTATSDGPLAMRSAPMFNQRFNVAASRAKDQLWLVHSLDHTRHLQPGDLRRRLIEHCLDPSVLRKEMESRGEETESPFEREVLEALVAGGFNVVPQYPVGALRIDLVVTDGQHHLAVECDGERFHGPDRLLQDMERQRVLERLGNTFHRIRGSAFYRHRERALNQLFERVRERGIQPKTRTVEPQAEAPTAGLRAEIVRNAERKMTEWGWLSSDEA